MTFGQSTTNYGAVQTGVSAVYVASDTATNTGDVYIGIGYSSSGYKEFEKDVILSVQPVTTQLTGTIAGTVYLQGSINGTNFVNIDSTNCGSTDMQYSVDFAVTATNGGSWLWTVRTRYPIYRVFYDASGTHTSTLAATYFVLKPED